LAGGEGLRFLAVPGVTPLEGGIRVSGVLPTQDAQSGIAALRPRSG